MNALLELLSRIFPPAWTVYKDISYGPSVADLYLLNAGVHPVVMWVHGGGWSSGDKSAYEGRARLYARAGFHSIAINYRLATFADKSTQWPAQLDDVRTAIQWIRKNAPAWRIDATRIAVAGDSAGGHLALMLGTTPDRPKAILNMFGPCDLAKEPLEDFVCALPIFNGQTCEQAPGLYAAASPINCMTAFSPPTMTLHGTQDATVPFAQAVELDAKLTALGIQHRLVPFAGGHGFAGVSATGQADLEQTGLQWVKACLNA